MGALTVEKLAEVLTHDEGSCARSLRLNTKGLPGDPHKGKKV